MEWERRKRKKKNNRAGISRGIFGRGRKNGRICVEFISLEYAVFGVFFVNF